MTFPRSSGLANNAAINPDGGIVITPQGGMLVGGRSVLMLNDAGTALVDGGGNPVMTPVSGVVQTVCMGDSFPALIQGGAGLITTAVRANNVVTVTYSSFVLGDQGRVNICNMVPDDFNANEVAATYISNTSFSYPSVGPDGAAASLGASKPMIFLSLQQQSEAGYFFWLNAISGGAFQMLHNAGVNGQTSADMRARFARDVLAYPSAQHIIFNDGYNSFATEGRTAQAAYDDMTWMIGQCGARAVTVIGCLPWTTGGTTANRAQAVIYNRMLRAYCESTPNVRYADAVKYIVDATNATRFSPLAGMLAADGIHPGPRGAYYIAKAIWEANAGRFSAASRLVSSNADNYGYDSGSKNILDNAPWVATGGALSGGATGTVATGWVVTNVGGGSVVASVVARPDGNGFLQRAVFTPAASNNAVNVNPAGNIGRLVPGKKMRIIMQVVLAGMAGANIKSLTCVIAFTATPNANAFVVTGPAPSAATEMNVDGTYTFVSQDITIPAGATLANYTFTATASAAGTALTIDVGAMSVELID